VTNATWRDFWLNEGFTTYLERRIIEDLYGPDRAAMEAVLGLQELRDELKRVEAQGSGSAYRPDRRDPDEGMNRIAYEKGALLLTTLEAKFGRTRFDAFLRGYLTTSPSRASRQRISKPICANICSSWIPKRPRRLT